MEIPADVGKAVQSFAGIVEIIDFRQYLRIEDPVDQFIFIPETFAGFVEYCIGK